MPEGLERDNFDTNNSDLRSHIEAAVAQHSTSPDVESVVNGAVEERNVELRSRNLDRWGNEKFGKSEIRGGTTQDRRRHTIRTALQSDKEKAAASPGGPKARFEIEPGAPKNWDQAAKADWQNTPHSVRQAVMRSDREVFDALSPHMQEHHEMQQVLAPHRQRFPSGMSAAQAVGSLLQWEAAFRSPNKHAAMAHLMNQVGVSFEDLVSLYYGQQQYQQPQYQQQYPQQYERQYQQQGVDQDVYRAAMNAAAENYLAQFSIGKPHYEKVRVQMGRTLLSNEAHYKDAAGNIDLDRLYHDACRSQGIYGSNNSTRRAAAAVSHRGRAPSGRSESRNQSVGSVRQSINNAIVELRA